MSLWLADELHVSLTPSRVGSALVRRHPSLHGVRREVVDRQSIACDLDTQTQVWDGSLKALDKLLPQYANSRPNVTMVLSNHFVCYTLVPWSDLVSGDDQQQAYIRHCFKTTYGDAAESWALRLSRSAVGASQLASAVDEKLLAACGEGILRHGLRLTSLQPYLMNAFNRFKSQIQQPNVWFVLAEPGSICMARLDQGKWTRFRAARLGSGWGELARFVVREAFLAESEHQAENPVMYLYAPHLGDMQTINGWDIHELQPPPPFNLPAEDDSRMGVALIG